MKKTNTISMQYVAALLIGLAISVPQGFAAETPVTAAENGGFVLGTGPQTVSEQMVIRNAFGYANSSEAYAYLRFAMDASGDTIGGVAVGDITSVTLSLTALNSQIIETKLYALDDLANPGAGFLTETSWTDSNLTASTAPHGNVDILVSPYAPEIGSFAKVNQGTGVKTPYAFSIELDVTAFKSLITNSSNDEITLIVPGRKDSNMYIASLANTNGYAVPTLNITTGALPPEAPDAPTGLTATQGDQSASLDWDDHAESNVTYSVYRALTSGDYGSALVTGLTTNNYLDSGLNNGTTYYYVVTATSTNTLESDQSDEVFVMPWDPNETNAPTAPTGLASTVGDGLVNLDWADNSEVDLASYSVYRSTNSGSYGAALASNLTSSAYADHTPSNGVTYYYAVSAVDNNGNESALSTEVDASPVALYFAKYTFSDLTLASSDTRTDSTASDLLVGSGLSTNFEQRTSGFRGNPIPSLTWKIGDCTDGTILDDDYLSFTVTADSGSLTFGSLSFDYDGAKEDVYLFSSQNGFDSIDAAIAAVKSTGFDNHVISLTGMVAAAESSTTEFRLYFKSTSTYLTGDLWIDNIFLDVTPAPAGPDLIPPAAPTGLSATASDSSVSLNWSDNTEEDWASYSIYRSTNSGSYSSSAWVKNLTNSLYVDDTAVNGTTYYYVVSATDTNGNESAKSTQVSATPPGIVVLTDYEIWLLNNGVEASDENFYEYAMDGDPTDGLPPANQPILIKSGSLYLYVHPKRSDDTTLTYTVETTTNLLDSGSWSATGYTVGGTDVTGGPLNFVTNEVDTVADERFIRLKIEQ